LIDLAETDTLNYRWSRADIYKEIYKKYQENGKTDKLEDIEKEILIFDLCTNKYDIKERFTFNMSGTTGTGEQWNYPDLGKDFPDTSIEYYKMRANTTKAPILKARYCDVIWELKREAEFARLAAEAYLNTCPIYYSNQWDYELSDSLSRTLTIAIMIKDNNLIKKAVDVHYKYINELVKDKRFRYLIEIIESLLERAKKIKDKVDCPLLIDTIELSISDYKQNDPENFHLQRMFMSLLLKTYTFHGNTGKSEETKVRIAESFKAEGNWKKTNGSNLVAAVFYEQAMKAYMDIGNKKEKVEELKVKIQQANQEAAQSEYNEISKVFEIPVELIENLVKPYKNRAAEEVYQIMAWDKKLIPSYENAKKMATEQAQEFVFQHIFPQRIMKGNICVKEIREEKEKLEYSAIWNYQLNLSVGHYPILNRLFKLLEEEHPDYIEVLQQFLAQSPIIEKWRLNIIEHGTRAYKNKEYLASIHILVFQIEGILRDLIGKMGLPIFSYRDSGMKERMLSDILLTLYEIDGIEKNLLKFIEIYLCEIKGYNYRNEISHGLLKEEIFTQELSRFLLLILIKLAPYTIIKKEKIES